MIKIKVAISVILLIIIVFIILGIRHLTFDEQLSSLDEYPFTAELPSYIPFEYEEIESDYSLEDGSDSVHYLYVDYIKDKDVEISERFILGVMLVRSDDKTYPLKDVSWEQLGETEKELFNIELVFLKDGTPAIYR